MLSPFSNASLRINASIARSEIPQISSSSSPTVRTSCVQSVSILLFSVTHPCGAPGRLPCPAKKNTIESSLWTSGFLIRNWSNCLRISRSVACSSARKTIWEEGTPRTPIRKWMKRCPSFLHPVKLGSVSDLYLSMATTSANMRGVAADASRWVLFGERRVIN